jgi:2-methylcitrate dehydratase PrpD
MEPQDVSMKLAKFVYRLSFGELPQEVVERTKSLILDALSAAIAGHDSNHTKIALGIVKDNKGNATVFGHGLRVPAVDATFVNSVSTTSIGQDDWASTYWAHPGSVVIPAAIAVGEQENSSGAEVITAVVAGYEIMGRIFLGAPSPIEPRFRSTTVIGPFGVAATAGKLLRLNEDQLADALGYAANFASGFRECFITGFMERKFNDAMASRNGVTAALLAKEGAKASRKSLEGECGFYRAFTGRMEVADSATIDLGKRFLIMDATYKPYPVDSELQITLYLALNLVNQYDIKGKDVAQVTEIWPEDEMTSIPSYANPGPFTSRLPAIQSAPFILAATLLGKPVISYTFYDNYNDPEVLKLAKNVKLLGEKGRSATRIEVTLRSGEQYSIEEGGTGFLVPTMDRVKAKSASLTSNLLGEEKVDKITEIVLNLDKVSNIRQLSQELG